ncbi:hypothetical protein [Sphingomonas sp.]|jgi:hypothetical protein|uniref:hypothetical protein n=1 Tax=Sphingomonas sp. TaxID=28214 RepID=UPI002DF5EC4E|nr:hypothetical protein [Sphingomonas sp.]
MNNSEEKHGAKTAPDRAAVYEAAAPDARLEGLCAPMIGKTFIWRSIFALHPQSMGCLR